MDWYAEGKMRQQEILHEAEVSRLLKTAQGRSALGRARVGSHFMVWLGGRMVASGRKLQTQYK